MAVDLGSAHGRIELDTSGVEQGVQRATKSITGMGPKLRALGDKIAGVGATLSLKLTAPLVALGGAASVAAIRFESSFAGVRKTVDASEGEFAMLRDSILDMAWSMDDATAALPDAQNKLAGIMEMAGQLGVEGADNLENFTATIAKLTMATNLTAEGAATELARFANITQMSMEHIDELGSVIVALGNNSATTEAEIVGMAQRMAAAGNQAGMTEADIMAISAAMSSVGIAAEAGGTAISRVLFDIDTAVRSSGSGIVNNTERIGAAQEDLILLYDKLAKAQEGLATATTEAGITGQIGMIVSGSRAAADGAVIEGEAIGVALAGPIYVGASAGMDETALHYISEDAGRLADSQPSTYLRPVGYPLSQTVFNLAPAAETPTAYGS